MNRPSRLAITTGDSDGIGLEIASKALSKLGPKKDWQFILFRSPKASSRDLHRIDSRFKRNTVSSWHEALTIQPSSSKELIDINSSLSPARWVEIAAQAAMLNHIDGLATAPISKVSIADAGLKDIGHTDILKRVSHTKDVYMGFLGSKFSIVLATGHTPLANVSQCLTKDTLEKAILAAFKVRSLLRKKVQRLPIGVLGLNPHAGESGIIGHEEENVHIPVIKKFREKSLSVAGPLIPDTAFFENAYTQYSVFVASYHDQGLIPFKSLHKHDANVHVTLGLPFIRTSVDHGTAKDIFGKNKADPSSMLKAIEFAILLSKTHSSLSIEKEL